MKEKKIHQYYKKSKIAASWIKRLLMRLGLTRLPKGCTLGPLPYITVKAGPNRHDRRKNEAIWRRYGAAAVKIAASRNISMDKALGIAMGGR